MEIRVCKQPEDHKVGLNSCADMAQCLPASCWQADADLDRHQMVLDATAGLVT